MRPTNPFVDVTGDGEIWSYGLRNAWRNAFDRDTGDLYIADVGQNKWEEIDFLEWPATGGENFGWRCREGANGFDTSGDCSATHIDPVLEYAQGGNPSKCSVTGGEVYRGCAIPDLRRTYLMTSCWLRFGSRVGPLLPHRAHPSLLRRAPSNAPGAGDRRTGAATAACELHTSPA
jgi:glucose/arabinose dehydrogenase